MIRDVSNQFEVMSAKSKAPADAKKPEEPQDPVIICSSDTLSRSSEEAKAIYPEDIPQTSKLSRFLGDAQGKAGDMADFLDDHITLGGIKRATEQTLKGIKAFPKFIYPSVYKMTSQEVEFTMGVLDKLPLKDVNSVKGIEMLPSIPDASGLAYRNPAVPYIQLSRAEANLSKAWAEEVTIHEVGHTKDYSTALFGMFRHESSTNEIWGKPPYISNYAKTNHWEDFAESYANYHLNPDKLKADCPEKFKRMQEMEKLGAFEKIIDRQAFRETGEYIGKQLAKVPYLTTGLNVLSYLVGFLQVAHGVGELTQARDTGDLKKKMDGTLDIAAGACFATKIFCVPGLALDGAKQALDRAIDKGEITAAQGNAVVQNTVGVIGGPIAGIAHWVKSKFVKHQAQQKPPQQQPQPEVTLGSLFKAGSIAIGGAAGTLAGGMIGPYMGVVAGFSVAGPLGGAIGLLAGALVGIYAGNKAGGELGSLIGDIVPHKVAELEGQKTDKP